jgi:uncharacterized protein YbjQ (UPF0145 family)
VADINDPAQRLNDLLDQQEVRIATIFRTAVEALKDEIDLDELSDLIAQGRIADALDRLQHAADALGAASNVAFVTSGQSTADFLTGANVGRIVFSQVNYGAVAAMQRNNLSIIREFTNEQRRATSAALISGVEAGINPRAQARNFRDSIGLTERQWQAVANYRASLERVHVDPAAASDAVGRALRDGRGDSQVRRAARDATALKPEKIDWLVERYTARYVKHRAEVIGRTEALRAVHQGNEEAYRQAIEDGTLDADRIERKWVTRLDGRERKTHLLLNNQKRGWGENWITENGVIAYPGDPDAPASETIQCRCALTTRIKQA